MHSPNTTTATLLRIVVCTLDLDWARSHCPIQPETSTAQTTKPSWTEQQNWILSPPQHTYLDIDCGRTTKLQDDAYQQTEHTTPNPTPSNVQWNVTRPHPEKHFDVSLASTSFQRIWRVLVPVWALRGGSTRRGCWKTRRSLWVRPRRQGWGRSQDRAGILKMSPPWAF